MISVIIPAYNVEKYIDACLRSVMNQKDAEYEVILVNDGSKDQTDVLCCKWAEQYENIKYIVQESKGQGTARNVAIENASGEWLVFLDADDEMARGALAALESCIEKADSVDIVWYEHILVRKQDSVAELIEWENEAETVEKRQIMRRTTTFLWDKMFRRAFWEQEGIVLSNLYGEDILPVYALLAKAAGVEILHKALVIHYEREDNLSSNAERVMELPVSIQNTLDYFKENCLFAEYQRELFVLVFSQIQLYQHVISLNGDCSKRMVKVLEQIRGTHFAKPLKNYEFVLIGGENNTVQETLLLGAYHYECIEKYFLHQIERKGRACNFIIGVENEAKAYFCGTRTEEWVCARWRAQCQELLHDIAKKYDMGGTTVVYRSRRTHPIYRRLEQIAVEVLQCPMIDDVLDIVDLPERTPESLANLPEYPIFDFRGEYLRLDYNCNVLKRWLELKLQNVSLEYFFIEKGYRHIAIYGTGYLGMLLWQDLQGTEVLVDYFLERIAKPDCEGIAVYGTEDKCPGVDVIVVSVVHQYDVIQDELKAREATVISLEEVLGI